MSRRPKPRLPASAPSAVIRSWTPSDVPSRLTGTPASNPTTTSTGSDSLTRVSVYTSSGAGAQGSSMAPHSIALPQRLSSMEYSFSLVTVMGISHLSASTTQSSRVRPHTRAGAKIRRSGASERTPTSKRTWSLPLPVHPWATAVAPWRRASATRWRTMTGRDRAETSGYFPS